MEFNDYIDYIKYEKKLSEETIKNYKYDLKQFNTYIKENNITDINKIKTKI